MEILTVIVVALMKTNVSGPYRCNAKLTDGIFSCL